MDWNNVALLAVTALTPVAAFVLVWLLKLAWSKIPAAWVFVAAPVAGVIADFVLSWIAGNAVQFTPLIGALLGLASIVLREFISTIRTKGITGPVTPTDKML